MCEYEKDILRLLDAHEKANKSDLIRNINEAIKRRGISRNGKNIWVCEVTGSPIGTVCTWFSYAKCRALNKIPLYAMCQIAVALNVSVWDFFETEDGEQKAEVVEIDRRSSLYWHIRRNEAENIWNTAYAAEKGVWEGQSNVIQREFLDSLYCQRIKEGREENG